MMQIERRNALIVENMDYARRLAAHFALQSAPRMREADDYIGEAYLALTQIAGAFDPTRGVKFTTYAYSGILGALRRKAARDSGFVKEEAEIWAASNVEWERAAHASGTEPSTAAMEQAVPGYSNLAVRAGVRNPAHIDTLVSHPADDAMSPEDVAVAADTDARIVAAVAALPPRLEAVARLRFIDGLAYEKILRRDGISRVTAWRDLNKAKTMLTESLHLLEAA